ncbi:MAG: copper chaperone PCu(A)C [bacterium]
MKRTVVPVIALLSILSACSRPASEPVIRVENVWSRPAVTTVQETGVQSGTGVVYLTLNNEGGSADRIVGVTSEVASVVEIHQTTMTDGVMKMAPVLDGLEIPAKGQVEFKPSGLHIMLIGLKRSLNAGDRFELILELEKSGKRVVESEVRAP